MSIQLMIRILVSLILVDVLARESLQFLNDVDEFYYNFFFHVDFELLMLFFQSRVDNFHLIPCTVAR